MKYQKVVEFYDKRYSAQLQEPGREPIPLVKGLSERIHQGSVLEIGAGRGDNSLFLAGKGFDVLATDISPVAVTLIQERAKADGISLRAQVLDVDADKLPGNFDVIVCAFTLHYLDRTEALEAIKKMQAHTKAGGFNVLTTFTKEGTFYKNASAGFYLDNKEELEALYSGWTLHKSFEREGMVRKPEAPDERHPNTFAGLLAQKTQEEM
jgi:tellurite methyltransferase